MTGQVLHEAAALFLAEYPARTDEFEAWLRDPSVVRHIARDRAGDVAGLALAWGNAAGRWRVELVVEPRLRNRSIGSGLLDRLIESVRRRSGITLQARAPASPFAPSRKSSRTALPSGSRWLGSMTDRARTGQIRIPADRRNP